MHTSMPTGSELASGGKWTRREHWVCGESGEAKTGGDGLLECRAQLLELLFFPLPCPRVRSMSSPVRRGLPGVNAATMSMMLHYKIDKG